MKDGAFVVNLDEDKSMGTHWIACMSMVIV